MAAIKEMIKLDSIMTNLKVKCNCGHSVYIPPHVDKIICTHCGKYIFKDKREEFKYRLNEMKRRLSNEKD